MERSELETPGQRLIRLQREYAQLPGVAVLVRIHNLDVTLQIFRRNRDELHLALAHHTANFIDLWALKNRSRLHALQLELTRLFHNFLAACTTLVDHTRKIYQQHYERTNGLPEYQAEIDKRFARDPLHCFIKDLRNYFLHVEALAISSELRNTADRTSSNVMLTRDVLERYREWKPLSQRYLEANAWDIDLTESCRQYARNIEAFQLWFRTQLSLHHRDELDAARLAEEEVRAAQKAAGFDDV